eukprot:TRINITY_DN7501_c0_g2_i3.p1 TRINITY_DN7501_c0_g2~~TRINITY_DN7501_c0_g2_i3.p1  ORF type:complete len:239 (+),score=32.90 TRINITY_DN7501_c0_g2_i3:53-769(+)
MAASISLSSLFDDVPVGLGHLEYAEPYTYDTYLKMPFNAGVNGFYLLVGLYWLRQANKQTMNKNFFTLMSTMSIIYACVQFMRITRQTRFWGIMDQWVTLPFFGLVIAWSWSVIAHHRARQLSPLFICLILFLSVASYLLVIVSPLGFACVGCCYRMLLMTPRSSFRSVLRPFILALLACTGFVMLKLCDHFLARHFWIFREVTGHFWSKICDGLQIHFVMRFFQQFNHAFKGTRKLE